MIKKLTIENVKKISFAEIEPKENLVRLRGKNAQGKTSVIKAIEMALCGQRALKEMPLKEGETAGSVILETDLFKVERNIYRDKYNALKTNLIVYDKKGNLVNKPQTFLNEIMGDSVVSPEVIIHKNPKERVEILKTAFGIDFSKLDEERGRLFQERTDRKKNEKLLTGQLKAYTHLPDKVEEARTAEEILGEIHLAEIPFNREREAKKLQAKERQALQDLERQRDGVMLTLEEASFKWDKLNKEIKKMTMEKDALHNQVKRGEAHLEAILDSFREQEKKISTGYTVLPKDIEKMDSLKAELKEVSLREKTIQEMKLRDKVYNDREQERKKVQIIGRQIDTIDNKKKAILRAVNFPVKGMQFGEHDILFNGIPFGECSGAEKIKIAVAINAETCKDAKIMKIEEGSALDDNSIKDLQKIAEDKGLQLWIEEVEHSDKGNVLIIEEGAVVNDK